MANNIPIDIMMMILSRLPVKSLIRFKSVSRSWKTLISDPCFVRIHLRQSKLLNLHDNNLFMHSYKARYSLVRLGKNLNFQIESKLERSHSRNVLCACDGVVLLTDDIYGTAYALWNPSTRSESLLHFPYKLCGTIKWGICYDPVTMDDFKVVIVSDYHYAVYSYKSKSWSKKRVFPYNFHGILSWWGIFIDGVIYWVANREGFKGREIVYFDPKEDDFKTLDKPQGLKESDVFYLVDLRGRLCLYCRIRNGGFGIWMKDVDAVSWKELMIIENVWTPIEFFEPLCLMENDDIVIRWDGERFVVYSPSKKTFRTLEETDHDWWSTWTPCPQTLLFPGLKQLHAQDENIDDDHHYDTR